jgi:cytochrome P450
MTTTQTGCPFHQAQSLPVDGTPLEPSPTFAAWREAAPAVPLRYDDGHEGLVVTRYDAARAILADPRFSQRPHRIPTADERPDPGPKPAHSLDGAAAALDDAAAALDDAPAAPDTLDEAAQRSIASANLLALDGDVHARMRRGITARFSLKQARARRPWIAATVAAQLEHLIAEGADGSPVDLTEHFAEPISARTHCRVIGVPDALYPEFVERFVGESSTQAKFDHIRRVVDARALDPGDDVISDLLATDVEHPFTRIEVEGLVFQLMSAGRDSVAYLIATATVGLLGHPEQLASLRDDPSRIGGAIEEFMRTGAMFLTLFPRTATEDVDIEGVHVSAGQTVSVSPVGANHDPDRFDHPDEFDIGRDAFGHLGFGHGPHGCIGQQMARVEIGEAVTQLITALPDLRLVDAEQSHPMPFANPIATYAAGSVLVTWTP